MLNILRKNIPGITVLQLMSDASCAAVAVLVALRFRGYLAIPMWTELAPACIFAVTTVCLNGAFGLYRRDNKLSFREQMARIFFAAAVGAPPAYLIADLLTGPGFWDTLGVAIAIAFVALLFVRQVVVPPLARTFLPHRILILGTGADARVVEASLVVARFARRDDRRFLPAGEGAGDGRSRLTASCRGANRSRRWSLSLRIREIIVAVREQRDGVLPLRSLLECRLNGVQVTEITRFFEQVHGRVSVAVAQAQLAHLRERLSPGLGAQSRQTHASTSSSRRCCWLSWRFP